LRLLFWADRFCLPIPYGPIWHSQHEPAKAGRFWQLLKFL
jgi:hypothetical protein